MPDLEPGLPVWHWRDSIEPLRRLLAQGGVLALPTESSYGLGADPRSQAGVEAIYRLKGRERGKPLPVVLANLEQARCLGVDTEDPLLARLAPFWPAPLLAIVPLVNRSSPLPAAAGTNTIAIRIPDHHDLRQLLDRLGHPLTATSANQSGQPPVLDLPGLNRRFEGTGLLVVDGRPQAGGAPSTVVSFRASQIEVERHGRFDSALL